MSAGRLQSQEQQRRLMLKEMGINPWLPREALPTAGRSHEIIFSLDNGIEGQHTGGQVDQTEPPTQSLSDSSLALRSAPATLSQPGKSAALDQAREMLGQQAGQQRTVAQPELPTSTEQRAKDNPQTTAGQAAMSDSPQVSREADGTGNQEMSVNQEIATQERSAENVAFNFTWVSVDERLALLAMMPGSETRIPASQRDMMKRMLVALDQHIDTSNLKARLFRWPLPGFETQSVAAARSAVEGFVAKQLNDRPAANVLVLSSELPVFLPESTPIGQLSLWESLSIQVLCTHAMHDMEDSTDTKREAWQHMQALRQLLISG